MRVLGSKPRNCTQYTSLHWPPQMPETCQQILFLSVIFLQLFFSNPALTNMSCFSFLCKTPNTNSLHSSKALTWVAVFRFFSSFFFLSGFSCPCHFMCVSDVLRTWALEQTYVCMLSFSSCESVSFRQLDSMGIQPRGSEHMFKYETTL